MARIPGEATEIRYRRTGPLAGRYYHTFRPGVRMHANRDGSVTLRGPAKIHAVESEPGFWEKYDDKRNPRRRSAARRAQAALFGPAPRYRAPRGGDTGAAFNWTPVWVLGLFWLWFRSAPSAGAVAVDPMTGLAVGDTGGVSLSDQLRSLFDGGAGPVVQAGGVDSSADVSTSDIVRTMQAQAEADAAAADTAASYTGLSDFLRSSVISATASGVGLFA